MSITLYGVDPSIDEAHWAKLLAILGRGSGAEVVDNGLVPSVATGTRLVSVSIGNAIAAGVLAESTSAVTVTLDANNGSNSRIDYIVLEVDWSGSSTGGGTVKFVKGTNGSNPIPPSLTRTAGTLWQIPLARVTVRAGVGQLLASDIELCRPLARTSQGFSTGVSSRVVGKNASDVVCETISIDDPGWPYLLVVSARMTFLSSASGHAQIAALINDATVSSDTNTAGNNDTATIPMAVLPTAYTGSSKVKLTVTPVNMPASLEVNSGGLHVLLVPA